MKKIFFSHSLSLFMVVGLLLSHVPLAAVAYASDNASSQEQNIFQYIYLGKELSNIGYLVEQASELDKDQNSLLHAMKNYMKDGFLIAGYDEVMETLAYAQQVIEDTIARSRDAAKNQLHSAIAELIEQIMDGALCFDEDSLERGCSPKTGCSPISLNPNDEDSRILNCCRFLLIDKELQVCGKAFFKGDVKIKRDLNVGDDLKVHGDATFKDDVKIKGSLTANDAFISVLDVVNGSIDNLTITDLVVSSCIDSLCVNNLSVTDFVVSSCMDNLCVNNLSVTDFAVASCMDTLCVQNLSATDAVIGNLVITSSILDSVIVNLSVVGTASVTDLVVLSCMDSLCVNDLSIVDISISGTLSVNDMILDDATISSLSATDVVINNSLTVPTLTPAGVVHNNAAGLLSSSLIVNADVAAGAGIVDTKLATISTAGKVANSATTATSANTANTIVARDGAGNFSAGTITAALNGNATTATSATTATTATNFTGSLAGEVTGTQGATVVTNAVSANTANAIVRRTATGGFSAGTISIVDAVSTGNLVFTGATSTSTTGNITKGGNIFIHNFGTNDTFVGINAGNFTMSGIDGHVAVGTNALNANTTGQTCTAVGSNALASHTSGTSNVGIGANSLNATTTPSFNIGLGSNSLLFNVTGARNVGLGDSALRNNITGSNNIAVGKDSLFLCTGDNNTAIGDISGGVITSGSNNISIGQGSGGTLSTGSGNIYIGANAALAAEATTTRIGTAQTACFIAGINGVTTGGAAVSVLIDGSGQLGTISSSERMKHDIEDMGSSSDAIMQLRPVTFVYNGDASNTTQYGLIAEEVDQAFPAIVVRDNEGQAQTVQYHVLPILLLNEMKKQQLTINDLQSLVKTCLDRISALEINA